MSNLTQIIKEDFRGVGRIVMGAVQGIYTPALMNTGVRQFANEITRDDKSGVEIVAKDTAQIVSACGIHVPLAKYAIEQGRGLEYFGALALTNVVDYLAHTYKRSKE
jgi:hypothetical protein